ncbi:MAG: hypothetical protein HND52_00965 [Ignavibacteriae bacterium]|jgi:uncharacterized glyoxalase superfamily protein PhnB|nr:hypothetical protein [Ignavibacteriota bacterium]NOG96519.1 hypothetical protein [Ignavibacteriota bacterium]
MNAKVKTYLTIPVLFIIVALVWSIVGNSLLKNSEIVREGSNSPLINKLTTNLFVKDVNTSIDFYTELLNFEVEMTVPDSGKLDFAIIRNGEIELMLQSYDGIKSALPNRIPDELTPSFLLFFEVSDLDSIYNKTKSAVLIKDKHQTFYGTNEFSIADPDDYIIGFSQFIEN